MTPEEQRVLAAARAWRRRHENVFYVHRGALMAITHEDDTLARAVDALERKIGRNAEGGGG